jgi:transposase
LPPAIERQLLTIEQLTTQVRAADRDVAQVAEAHDVCRRLTTVPGIGPTTALRYVAALDTVGRFPSAHAVEAYLGLTPGEKSSSGRQRRLGITKAGPRALRSLLVQAAWAARRAAPTDPLVRWARAVEQRRGRKAATIALARKLAGILYALWRDDAVYIPSRGAN